jgi:hypothetical protein
VAGEDEVDAVLQDLEEILADVDDIRALAMVADGGVEGMVEVDDAPVLGALTDGLGEAVGQPLELGGIVVSGGVAGAAFFEGELALDVEGFFGEGVNPLANIGRKGLDGPGPGFLGLFDFVAGGEEEGPGGRLGEAAEDRFQGAEGGADKVGS